MASCNFFLNECAKLIKKSMGLGAWGMDVKEMPKI
jgi:hypothetical protein